MLRLGIVAGLWSALLITVPWPARLASAGSVELLVRQSQDAGGFAYDIEIEIAPDAPILGASVLIPAGGAETPLAFDAGEMQWDFEWEDLSLVDINSDFLGTWSFELMTSSGSFAYAFETQTSPVESGDFTSPLPQVISVGLNASGNPTASWISGNTDPDLVDFILVTYRNAVTGDELNNPPTDDLTTTSDTLLFVPPPGLYEVTVGYYSGEEEPIPFSMTPGAPEPLGDTDGVDVFLISADFSDVFVVPEPAAAVLMVVGCSALALARRRRAR